MYRNYQIKKLADAVNDIILPKFEQYLKDRRNDLLLQKRIDAVITKIEKLEDTLNNNFSDFDFSESNWMSINLGKYYFHYNKATDEIKFGDSIENFAEREVWAEEGLYNTWESTEAIRTRVLAILSTIEETSFDKVVEIVEHQIDFNEFINRYK